MCHAWIEAARGRERSGVRGAGGRPRMDVMAYRLAPEQPERPQPDEPAREGDRRRRRRLRGGEPGFRGRIARKGVAVLPTLFTLGNLLAGCAAIFLASRPENIELPFDWSPLTFAAVCIFVGMAFDGLDGRIARLTRSVSGLGEQLDSMSDMVTFGVAPAFIAVQLVGVGVPFVADPSLDVASVTLVQDRFFDRIAIVVAAIYACCAALRLARFNVEVTLPEEADHNSFKGLPSPGAAGTVASLVLLHEHFLKNYPERDLLVQAASYAMVAVMLLAALAMVSQFRYVHVLNRYVRNRAPFDTVAKAVIVLLLMAVHLQGSLAAAFVLYALSAPAVGIYRWATGAARPAPVATPNGDPPPAA